jgi:Restriction endonuclease XhoI
MGLNLVDYEEKAAEAVRLFWRTRHAARQRQADLGKVDQGERSAVTSGKNMDGFLELIVALARANGLAQVEIHEKGAALTLPGFFRPTKLWDLLILHKGELIAAIELKSQVGSFGKNFNNRAEEAIGTAQDFWTAHREGAYGEQPQPFVGWFMLVEDAAKSRAPVRESSPHFPVFEDFKDASYLKRYDVLCRRLMAERLYTCATVLVSARSAVETGEFAEMSPMTGLRSFVTSFAGHIAATAARLA